MPVYVLATVPEMELYKYMQSALDTVMQPLGMRKVRIRIQVSSPEIVHGNRRAEYCDVRRPLVAVPARRETRSSHVRGVCGGRRVDEQAPRGDACCRGVLEVL